MLLILQRKPQNILSEVNYESSRTDEQNLENVVSFFFFWFSFVRYELTSLILLSWFHYKIGN